MSNKIKWCSADIEYLKCNYFNVDKDILCEYLNRSWNSIKLKASSLNLNRSSEFTRKSNMSKLLNNNLESFYWVGFLLADGHFDLKSKRIKLSLSKSDKKHMERLCSFLEMDSYNEGSVFLNGKEYKHVSISFQNVDIFDKIINKFDIKENKTKIPPEFNRYNFEDSLMIALIIGFIDGDGNISKLKNRNDYNIRFHLHEKWLNNLMYIEGKLFGFNNNLSKIGNDGYSRLVISRNSVILKLKKFVDDNKLPVMSRKWDKIDKKFESKYEIFRRNRFIIKNLLENGYSIKEICNEVGCGESTVYKVKRMN